MVFRAARVPAGKEARVPRQTLTDAIDRALSTEGQLEEHGGRLLEEPLEGAEELRA